MSDQLITTRRQYQDGGCRGRGMHSEAERPREEVTRATHVCMSALTHIRYSRNPDTQSSITGTHSVRDLEHSLQTQNTPRRTIF